MIRLPIRWQKKAAAPGEPLATMDLNELRYEPFVLMDKTSTLRSSCDLLFEKAGSFQIFSLKPTIPEALPPWFSPLCAAASSTLLYAGTHRRCGLLLPADRPSWEIAISCQKHGYLNSAQRNSSA